MLYPLKINFTEVSCTTDEQCSNVKGACKIPNNSSQGRCVCGIGFAGETCQFSKYMFYQKKNIVFEKL